MARKQARSSRKTVFKVVLFLAIAGIGLFLMMSVVSSRRSRLRRTTTPLRTPAAGAAAATLPDGGVGGGDGGDGLAIVEDARRYAVKSWSFSLDRYDLRIEDVNMSTALDSVLTKTGAELVVNGGFFDPDGKPVGLAMSEGAIMSRFKTSLSGGVLMSDGAHAQLFATEGFSLADDGGVVGGDAAAPKFAVQCRPRLVVDRAPNVKSDDGKRAERTALCTRDEGRRVDVIIVRRSDDGESPGPSLFALANHLATSGCDAALNLDGGPSTGVAWRTPGEDKEVHLLAPRSPVRFAIAFREKR